MSDNSLFRQISDSQTEFELFNLVDYPQNGGYVKIEDEVIRYQFASDRALIGCTRGYAGTTAAAHAAKEIVTFLDSNEVVSEMGFHEWVESYNGSGSRQGLAYDLEVGAQVGSDEGTDPKYIAPAMFNLLGADLENGANYLGGVIGAYSITGTKATSYPAGAVLGQITDGVTEADGAFVAYVDGDGSVTTARAAYAVMSNNSTPGSGFEVGLDLQGEAHDGYNAVEYSVAEIRFSNGTKVTVSGDDIIFTNAAGTKTATVTMA